MNAIAAEDRAPLRRCMWWSLAVCIAPLLACIIGAPFDPAQFFRAYLTSYVFYLGLGVGGLALLQIHQLTGGAWGFLLRRVLEAQMKTLPLLAVLFTPIAVGIQSLYLWARPELVAESKHLQEQTFYLNSTYFWGRAAAYFVVWVVIALAFGYWSRRQDQTGEKRYSLRLLNFAGPFLVIYGITVHFSSIDWIMSLEPVFHSTIFGPLVAVKQLLSALAFALLIYPWLRRRAAVEPFDSLQARNDFGGLLLTLLILWAYMVWFQFMLIWITNLKSESVWYLNRVRGGWKWVGWSIFLLHFAAPFFLLLLKAVKQHGRWLTGTAALLLLMELVHDYYMTTPAFQIASMGERWMEFLMPVGLGGLWLACFLWNFARRPLLPLNDFNRSQALLLRRADEEEEAREEALAHG